MSLRFFSLKISIKYKLIKYQSKLQLKISISHEFYKEIIK